MSMRGWFYAAYFTLLGCAIAVVVAITSSPAAAAEQPNYIDRMAFAYWGERHPTAAERAIADQLPAREHRLPPPDEWYGDIRVCDADHNPPEWMTRFGGFCQQIAYPDRQSLMFTGTDAIFKFKHN